MSPARVADTTASNGRWAVAISYSTAPAAQISVRGSAGSPRNCSGAMYGSVPVTSCDWVSVRVAVRPDSLA